MIKTLLKVVLFIFAFGSVYQASAQWEVGEEVDMHLSSLKMYTYIICPPTPTHLFWFPVSEVTGVDHVAIVDSINTNGKVEIGVISNEVKVGDTIFIESADIIPVYFYADSGNVVLEFKAVGTPTQADEPVPCDKNEVWLMTFPLCNISNSPAFVVDQDSCFTEESTSAIEEHDIMDIHFDQPMAQNSFQLMVNSAFEVQSMRVYNIKGQLIKHTRDQHMDCSTWQSGVYILNVEIEGKSFGYKFSLVK